MKHLYMQSIKKNNNLANLGFDLWMQFFPLILQNLFFPPCPPKRGSASALPVLVYDCLPDPDSVFEVLPIFHFFEATIFFFQSCYSN